jgi:c-di-GMP-binding flagellar brake protein YcgR
MTEKKTSWDDIPSLDDLQVDWEFEPENPLGKRSNVRITAKDLRGLLSQRTVHVKILAEKQELKGTLEDLSETGAAVILEKQLPVQLKIAFGFFLGKEKIVSKAVVKSSSAVANRYRIGLEFFGLQEKPTEAIQAIVASKSFIG